MEKEIETAVVLSAEIPKGKPLDTRMLEFCARYPGARAIEIAQERKTQKRKKTVGAAVRVLLCAVSGVFLFSNWGVFLSDAQVALQAVGCVASLLIITDSMARAIATDNEE